MGLERVEADGYTYDDVAAVSFDNVTTNLLTIPIRSKLMCIIVTITMKAWCKISFMASNSTGGQNEPLSLELDKEQEGKLGNSCTDIRF